MTINEERISGHASGRIDSRMHGAILAYHLVDRRFALSAARITPRQFSRQMRWMCSHGLRGIPVRAFIDCLQNKQDGSTLIAITFDDGYASLLDYVVPVSHECGFSGSIFVVSDYIGRENRWDVNLSRRGFRHLSWSDLRVLSQQGWEIGSHSRSHAYLPALDERSLWCEVWDSKTEIEQQLGGPVTTFSVPFGRGNHRVFAAIEKAGYRTALVLGQGVASEAGCMILPRRGVYRFDTLWSFRRKLTVRGDGRWQALRQAAISSFSMGSVVLRRFAPPGEKS